MGKRYQNSKKMTKRIPTSYLSMESAKSIRIWDKV
jgi:hypothetical protein